MRGRVGVGGPLPKPEGQRRNRNKPAMPTVAVPAGAGGSGLTWPPADPSWHPLAVEVYAALPLSAQAAMFQPTDVAVARVVLEGLSRCLHAQRFSPTLFAACCSSLDDLAATVGARLRLRMQLKPDAGDARGPAVVAQLRSVLYGDRGGEPTVLDRLQANAQARR